MPALTISRHSASGPPPGPPEAGALNLPYAPPSPGSLPLLNRILHNRGLDIAETLATDISQLPPAGDFPALARAVPLVADALDAGILVVGDYDADGICSTSLTTLALRSMGARELGHLLPNRFSGGYGLSEEMVKQILDERKPGLVIAVDHGTNSGERIEELLAHNIKALVLDHHQPGKDYQAIEHPGYCIVNPLLEGCRWPDRELCAGAVSFFAMAAVRNHLVREGRLEDSEENKPGRWLDMVALATSADQMPMSRTNRILVEQGLRRIRAGRAREGIRHLLRLGGQPEDKVNSRHLSHMLAPRLNAAGRVGNPDIAVDFLLADSLTRAHRLAEDLEDLNARRKDIERQMARDIDGRLGQIPDDAGLACLADPGWNIGVVGIGAAKLARRLNRPAIIFAPHPQRDEWVGSGRAPNGEDSILTRLDAIAEQAPGIFVNYGGHHQAVGATVRKADMERLMELASAFQIDKDELPAPILTDGELAPDEMTLANAQWLSLAVAWGKGLAPPIFDGAFTVLEAWPIGQGQHIKASLAPDGAGDPVDAVRFYFQDEAPEPGQRLHAVYELNVNRYRNNERLQLIVQHWELL